MPDKLEEELKRRASKLAKAGKLKSMHVHMEMEDDKDDALEKAKNAYVYGTMNKIKKVHSK